MLNVDICKIVNLVEKIRVYNLFIGKNKMKYLQHFTAQIFTFDLQLLNCLLKTVYLSTV